ncbi:hypothetical protein Tco_1274376 [Tanacetum coccineum]
MFSSSEFTGMFDDSSQRGLSVLCQRVVGLLLERLWLLFSGVKVACFRHASSFFCSSELDLVALQEEWGGWDEEQLNFLQVDKTNDVLDESCDETSSSGTLASM